MDKEVEGSNDKMLWSVMWCTLKDLPWWSSSTKLACLAGGRKQPHMLLCICIWFVQFWLSHTTIALSKFQYSFLDTRQRCMFRYIYYLNTEQDGKWHFVWYTNWGTKQAAHWNGGNLFEMPFHKLFWMPEDVTRELYGKLPGQGELQPRAVLMRQVHLKGSMYNI
jgi:hypothetical protein